MQSLHHNIISSPATMIDFCGFRAQLHVLQDNGWEISADQHVNYSFSHSGYRVSLMLRHSKAGMTMMTNNTEVDRHAFLDHHWGQKAPELYFRIVSLQYDNRPPMYVEFMNHMDFMPLRAGMDPFHPIDASPKILGIDLNKVDLYSHSVFRKLDVESNIFVPETSAAELMDIILKKQAPKQAEIRERRRREGNFEKDSEEKIMAQVIAI